MTRDQLLQIVEERSEFITLEDGYVYYWPSTRTVHHSSGGTTGGEGAYEAWELRAIADELDRRNAAWETQVRTDLSEAKPE